MPKKNSESFKLHNQVCETMHRKRDVGERYRNLQQTAVVNLKAYILYIINCAHVFKPLLNNVLIWNACSIQMTSWSGENTKLTCWAVMKATGWVWPGLLACAVSDLPFSTQLHVNVASFSPLHPEPPRCVQRSWKHLEGPLLKNWRLLKKDNTHEV